MYRMLRIVAGLTLLVIPAWFIVPNYLQARNRSRQKRTMADIRSIATAWEARATDINSYSVGARRNSRVGGGAKMPAEQRVTTAELARALEPKYIRELPGADGWGEEFQFTTGDDEVGGQGQTYVIRSLGSDGRPDRIANLSGASTSFEDDIVYSQGGFVRYPESAG
jgi:type II secretory pathway pseudopilin PulG